MKQIIKNILSFLGIYVTKNQKYDALANAVMKKVLRSHSNCVDVGSHEGEFLRIFQNLSPNGQHFGYEPIPSMFEELAEKFNGNVTVSSLALSDTIRQTEFMHVKSNPAYSGLKKREYKQVEEIEKITIQTSTLDKEIPNDLNIDFIKIDVEGAELEVLRGGKETIKRSKPVIIFEHGLGASDKYGTKPEDVYDFLVADCQMNISLLEDFIGGNPSLSKEQFSKQFHEKLNYYFISHS